MPNILFSILVLLLNFNSSFGYVNPPSILSPTLEDQMLFARKQTVEIPCRANGNPLPKLSWKKNKREVLVDKRIQLGNGKLIIKNAGIQDEGYYQCYATNSGGTAVSDEINLRMGYLEDFTTKTIKYQKVKIGKILRLSCDVPRSFPKPKLSWVHEGQKNNSIIPVILNRRIAMDPEGNLFILAVEEKDFIDGKKWGCVVRNKFLDQTKIGSFNVIQPQPALAQNQTHQLLYSSPNHQVALPGQTIQFHCIFGGESTLNIQWGRTDGQSLKNSHEIENFGRRLTLHRVDETDAGTYFCFCRGMEHHIELKIKKNTLKPEWEKMAQSVDANEFDNVEFQCTSKDKKNSSTFWYINGVTIGRAKPDPKRIVSGNSLIIKNVTKADVKVIQCNVTNNYGYVFTNAYLNINSMPEIYPKDTQSAVEGANAIFQWKIIGHPKPEVYWMRGNVIISEDQRFRVTPDGNLKIYNVSQDDAGLYTCSAANSAGNMSASGSLVVLSPSIAVNKQDHVYQNSNSKDAEANRHQIKQSDTRTKISQSKVTSSIFNKSPNLEIRIMNLLSMSFFAILFNIFCNHF